MLALRNHYEHKGKDIGMGMDRFLQGRHWNQFEVTSYRN